MLIHAEEFEPGCYLSSVEGMVKQKKQALDFMRLKHFLDVQSSETLTHEYLKADNIYGPKQLQIYMTTGQKNNSLIHVHSFYYELQKYQIIE